MYVISTNKVNKTVLVGGKVCGNWNSTWLKSQDTKIKFIGILQLQICSNSIQQKKLFVTKKKKVN